MNTYIHTLHIQKNKYISKQINTQTHTHTRKHIIYIYHTYYYICIYIYTHMSYSCDIQKKAGWSIISIISYIPWFISYDISYDPKNTNQIAAGLVTTLPPWWSFGCATAPLWSPRRSWRGSAWTWSPRWPGFLAPVGVGSYKNHGFWI